MTTEFNKPKMWQFVGHVPHTVAPTPANRLTAPQTQMRHKTVGVLAMSFDRAYVKVRELLPELRISQVSMHDQNVDLIVDDPVAWAVAQKLEQ